MSQYSEQLTNELNVNLGEILASKYILFDTCVVSRLSNSKTKSPTTEIFDFLNDIKCIPGISEQIYVEYLRDHQNSQSFEKAREFLSKFPRKTLSSNRIPNFDERMIIIDRINQNYGYRAKQISYVDLTIAVFLHYWPDNLFLATFNIKDFCHKIFDVIYVMPVIFGNNLELLGIIKANRENLTAENKKLINIKS